MNVMRVCFALSILIILSSFTSAQQPGKEFLFEFHGKVVDVEKIPYGAMHLDFVKDGFAGSALSDEKGNFSVKLPAGNYQVKTHKDISDSFVAFIDIDEKRMNPDNVEFVIDLNKNWCTNCSAGNMPGVIKYVSPPYPPTAKAVGAAGLVVMEIKISSEGKVIDAKAVSGHPLLKSVSASAAKNWLFSPDQTILEREGKLMFAFNIGDSKEAARTTLRKPNLLEIIAMPDIISQAGH